MRLATPTVGTPLVKERTKTHMIARHIPNTVDSEGRDISEELIFLYFPDSDCAMSVCGHLYDPGICVTHWDDVSCKNCLKKMQATPTD